MGMNQHPRPASPRLLWLLGGGGDRRGAKRSPPARPPPLLAPGQAQEAGGGEGPLGLREGGAVLAGGSPSPAGLRDTEDPDRASRAPSELQASATLQPSLWRHPLPLLPACQCRHGSPAPRAADVLGPAPGREAEASPIASNWASPPHLCPSRTPRPRTQIPGVLGLGVCPQWAAAGPPFPIPRPLPVEAPGWVGVCPGFWLGWGKLLTNQTVEGLPLGAPGPTAQDEGGGGEGAFQAGKGRSRCVPDGAGRELASAPGKGGLKSTVPLLPHPLASPGAGGLEVQFLPLSIWFL